MRVTPFILTPFILTSLLSTSLLFAQRDTVPLAPVIVTATRFAVPVEAIGSAVTVITGEELRLKGVRTVAEALRAVPGATVVETGSFGGQTSLFLRGGESDYVKVLLDGVPLNQPGGAFDFADLTTDNVERIEIVRGPGSVLYGSDAVTGVIQILTRGGQGAPRVTAAARAGNYGSSAYEAGLVGGTARAGYSLGVSQFWSDGLYPYNNDYRNTVVSGRVRVTPDDRTDASLAYRWGDNTYHFPTNGAGQPVDSNQFSADRGPTLSLDVGRWLGAGLEARATAGLRETRPRFEDRPDSPGEDGAFESRDWVRRASGGALVTWRRAGSAVTAGIEYEDERQRGRSVFSGSFGTFPDSIDVRRWNRAYYAQALLGIGRPVTVQLGRRWDDNSQFGVHATWRAGASYRAPSRTRVRVAVGTGFKEPTFFENFARGFVTGNPDLDPERSTSWEVGIERPLAGGRVAVGATYFDQRFHDLIDFTGTPPPGSPNYFNIVGAAARGVEATIDAVLGSGVTSSLRYTYLHTTVDDTGFVAGTDAQFAPGRRLLRRPTHALSQQLAAPLGARGNAALTVRFVGDREDFDFSAPSGPRRVTLHPYFRMDLAAALDVLRRAGAGLAATLTARLENVFNDDAREIANFPARGRTLFFGGQVRVGS